MFCPDSRGLNEHKHHLRAGGETFALHTQREGNLNGKPPKAVSYFHHDHLGSLAVISNAAGAVIERLAYDPWGKRRQTNGLADSTDTLTSANTKRGYTMHEHMDEMGVINMNGRVYDPAIGRFLTADPFIQAPGNLQSYNRYAYVLNNPLAYTDPTGYFSWRKAWKKLKGIVLTVAAAYLDAMGCAGYCSMALNAYNAAKAKNPIGFVLAFTGLPSNAIAAAAVTAASGCVGAMASGGNCGRGAGSALIQHVAGEGGVLGRLAGGCAASANQGGSCRKGVEAAATSMATNYLAGAARAAGEQVRRSSSDGSGGRSRGQGSQVGGDFGGHNGRGGFPSMDAAARHALNTYNRVSIWDNREYGGLFYQNGSGEYEYTVIRGGVTGVNPMDTLPQTNGNPIAGDWHTHGDYSSTNGVTITRTSNPNMDSFNSDQFSRQDISSTHIDAKSIAGYKSYLGTPSGVFRVYDADAKHDGVFK